MTPTTEPNVPDLDQLATLKNGAYDEIAKASSALKKALREAAGFENQCAGYFIANGSTHEAIKHFVSEASLLVQADEFAEAASIFRNVLTHTEDEISRKDISEKIAVLDEVANNIKVQKPIDPLGKMLETIGASPLVVVDGNIATERFVTFMFEDIDFRVDVSSVYRLSSGCDPVRYDLTTIDRVEERLRSIVANEQQKNSYEEDFDPDYDNNPLN